MVNWYIQKTLLLLLICFCWAGQSAKAAALKNNTKLLVDEKIESNNWTAQIITKCAVINPAYQEVYSFETQDYHINICRLGDDFYYRRQSKSNQSIIFIPAQAVFLGNIFQATDGKTNYFVGKDGDRYYSSVMQNSNEIVFEPELRQPNLSGEIAEANSTLPQDLAAPQTTNASLELDNPDNTENPALVCTNESSAFHPDLDGWQKLIGKSTAIANKYATNNGHDFIYNEQNPELALISTDDGAIVNLSIASSSKTIERICIESQLRD